MMALEQTHALRDAVEEHQGVLEAIARGMGRQAADRMHAHVEHFEATMREVLAGP